MKKLYSLLIAAISFCLPNNSFSQVNEYFDHIPVWKVSSMCGVLAPCIQYENYNYYCNGDTVINSLVYKKIYRKGSGNYQWFGPPPVPSSCQAPPYTYVNPSPSYYARSAGKQMFVWPQSDTTEYLLYDFDLNVGDTLPLTINNFDPNITVMAIDSFYTPYGYRKSFELSGNSWTQFLYEGIGHARGFVEPVSTPLECGFTLECFSLNDTSYIPSVGLNCDIFAGIQLPSPSIPMSISPNPFNDFTEIDFHQNLQNIEISIYDRIGKRIFSEEKFSGQKFKIDGSKLNEGVYLLEIKNGSNFFETVKLVVTN